MQKKKFQKAYIPLKEPKIVFHKNRFDWGSIPVEGSSNKTTFGAPNILIP